MGGAALHLHLGGVPTGPDRRLLLEAFKDRAPGDLITYNEIVEVIGVSAGTSRFNTVVNRWRDDLRRLHNFETERPHAMNAVRILPHEERDVAAVKVLAGGTRKIGRSVRRFASIPVEKLTAESRDRATHGRRVAEAILSGARDGMKQIAATFTPPKQLPRAR